MSRDYQRSKLYHAEDVAFNKSKPAEFDTLAQCREFAELIINSRHWKYHKGLKRYRLKDGRGRSNACARAKGVHAKSDEVVLPRWSRSRWLMCHEFAHNLTERVHPGTSAHGSLFAGHYLSLIEELLGDDAEFLLRSSFNTSGVKYAVI